MTILTKMLKKVVKMVIICLYGGVTDQHEIGIGKSNHDWIPALNRCENDSLANGPMSKRPNG